ncbi:hypothetical protein N7481_002644 [Penicillium waksmanii]|uniref:uncharacterized protein n=1 Tax=Penicillium waksmanii TaxID=69791 RepID=UPI0025476096|nr:uncharacterized protein N7481_002644 [Penicillium waksmanii]KAJ5995667.1 hypothetical protein N7481_002644 [Penicillium waksmanii]
MLLRRIPLWQYHSPPPPPLQHAITNLSEDTQRSEHQIKVDSANATSRIDAYESANRGVHENLVKVALRVFITWLPPEGSANIVNRINDASLKRGDQGIYEEFANLYTGLRARMHAQSKPPTITESHNERSMHNVNSISSQLDEPGRRQINFRNGLLNRDHHRCVVTGDMDVMERERRGDPPEIELFGKVEGAHIIPFSYGTWKGQLSASTYEISKAWEVLLRCFPAIQQAGFGPNDINHLSNGMVLRSWLHTAFREFSFAFKATENRHVYEIDILGKFDKRELPYFPAKVDFRGCEGPVEDYPKPELLECHWRLGKILHASGMAEAFEKDFREWDELKGLHRLRPDGQTDIGDVLSHHPDLWAYVCAQEA